MDKIRLKIDYNDISIFKGKLKNLKDAKDIIEELRLKYGD
jgi:hypothetical protein